MSIVVDASVVVALAVGDARERAVTDRMEGLLDAGQELHAPGVLPYEIANVLARRVFDGLIALDLVPEIWRDLSFLGLILHGFDLTRDGPAIAVITSQLRRRHATDAAYVHLAQRLGTTVWTLDQALARNAAGTGLPVALLD